MLTFKTVLVKDAVIEDSIVTENSKIIIAIDIGSSAIKVSLFVLGEDIELLFCCTENIGLYSPRAGYVENDPEEVWDALCRLFKKTLSETNIDAENIECVSICSQAQCVVLVDKNGQALTPVYNSQDSRAEKQFKELYAHGITICGMNVFKVLGCILDSGFLPGSAKDPVFKFKWAEENLPEEYKKAYKWLDMKDYIICKLTGKFITTRDNAHAMIMYRSKENKKNWSKKMSEIFRVDMNMLPDIIESDDIAGYVTEAASEKSGLLTGTPILGGIIDSTGVQYGSGAVDPEETMVYWGTSGWVGIVTDKPAIDFKNKIGYLLTPQEDKFHFYACLDSAGISYKWLLQHIIKDDGILEFRKDQDDSVIYSNMNDACKTVSAGSEGLMFAPWITGCRAPMEASQIGGMFLNIKRNMDKKHFIRAVVEGICYHFRLLMEASAKSIKLRDTIRFVGGGANSDEISQILADITGCTVEVPKNPQDAGALGAAIMGFYAIGNKKYTLSEIAHMQKPQKTFVPDVETHSIYNRYYSVYKKLYNKNKNILSELTAISESEIKQ